MKLDAYEYVGLVVPGSIPVFVLTLLSDPVREVIAKDGIDLGGFGIFVLLALVVGFLVQAIGNWIETIERWTGVDVSARLLKSKQIVTEIQRARLDTLLQAEGYPPLSAMSYENWRAIRAIMASHIRSNCSTSRLDTFVRMYGLGRGLAAAFLLSLAMTLAFPAHGETRWTYLLVLAGGTILAYSRSRRFSTQYLRELVVEYTRASALKRDALPEEIDITEAKIHHDGAPQ